MIYLWATLLTLVNAFWLTLLVFGLPGIWLMVATTALVAWWQWDAQMFSAWTLVAVVVLAAVSEVLEFIAGVAGVAKAGGTRYGAWGALGGGFVGAIAGTFLLPVPFVGTLVGACVGAGVGAYLMELSGRRSKEHSVRVGVSAGMGRFYGTVIKLAIGVAVWVILAVAAYWP